MCQKSSWSDRSFDPLRALAATLVASLLALAPPAFAAASVRNAGGASGTAAIDLAALPPSACATLVLIQKGGPFPFPQDGATFVNREQRLPSQQRGYYTEYTVPTPGSRDRGARRIIAGLGMACGARRGEYWYTGDHYRTLRRIRLPPASQEATRLDCAATLRWFRAVEP
jgi:ribonuclease T1